jgi:hypothetical protein
MQNSVTRGGSRFNFKLPRTAQSRYECEGDYVLAAKPEFVQLAHNQRDDRSTFNASPITAEQLTVRMD